MDQATFGIYAYVGFVSEVPGIALFNLMCLRVPLLFLVFGRRGRRDNGGVHNGSLFQNQTPLHEHGDHLRKELLLQAIPYQQIPETSQRVTVGHLIAGIHAAKF